MTDERKFKVGQRVRTTRVIDDDAGFMPEGTEGNINTVLNQLDSETYEVRFDAWPGLWLVDVTEIEAIEVETQPADTRTPSRFWQPPADTSAEPPEAAEAPMCPICGNYPVEPGYRVCPSCVAAREHAPHYWLDELPDKIEPAAPPEAAEYEMDMTCPICGAGDHDCEHFMLPDGTFNQDAFDDSLNERRIQRGLTPLEIPGDVLLEINGIPQTSEAQIAETVGVLALQSAYGAMVEELERERDEALTALKPFADLIYLYDNQRRAIDDILSFMFRTCDAELTEANFRRAAAASEPGADTEANS